MKTVLIILGAIAALAVLFFIFILFSMYRSKREYRRSHPYDLGSLTDEEKNCLADMYEKAIAPEYGSFRGGGVWRREASLDQKSLLGDIRRGRLDESGMDTVKRMVFSLMEANRDNEEARSFLSALLMKLNDCT